MSFDSEKQIDQEKGENPASINENETSQDNISGLEKNSQANELDRAKLTVGTLVSIFSLLMFVGGALVTFILLAKAFDLHGQLLVAYVIGASSLVLGLAGYLITNIMGDKPIIGAAVGFIFGGFSAFVLYLQTQNYSWWQ